MGRKITLAVVLALFLVASDVRPGEAFYIDPNTGGMLFQILAAIFAAFSGLILVFSSRIRMWIARLARTVRRRSGKEAGSESGPESSA